MESFRKISSFLLAGLILLSLVSCKTTLKILELAEVTPLPKQIVVEKKLEYEPIYTVLRIVEVSEENGVQKNIFVKLGEDSELIKTGTECEISADAEFVQILGTCKIRSKSGGFLQCSIISTNHKIPGNSYIRIKIGEKVLGE